MTNLPPEIARIIGDMVQLTEGEHVFRINEINARLLINTGLAGYWSILAEHPIAHAEWCCAYVQSRWFLCHADALKVTDAGRIGNEDVNAQAHIITISSDPLIELVERDKAEHALALEEYRYRKSQEYH